MKPYCRHCRNEKHWTAECPELNSFPSTGAPRVEANQGFLTRKDPPEKPLPPRRKPWEEKKPAPTTNPQLEALVAEVANLKRQLATSNTELQRYQKMLEERNTAVTKTVTENPPALQEIISRNGPVTKKGRGRPATETSLTPAERMRLYRARKRGAGRVP